jgi:limonene-1,2-epoxide hydrolase
MTIKTTYSANEQLAVDFFHGMGPTLEAFERNFDDRLAHDAEWESVGLPVRRGRTACIDHLHDLHERTGMEYCTIDLIALAGSGDTVLSERVDTMWRADGSPIMTFRIMGAIEIRDGKIVRYTDYFDLALARASVAT